MSPITSGFDPANAPTPISVVTRDRENRPIPFKTIPEQEGKGTGYSSGGSGYSRTGSGKRLGSKQGHGHL